MGQAHSNHHISFIDLGARDVAQLLRALAFLLEDSGLIPSTYMATYNCVTPVSRSITFYGFCGHQACMWYIDIMQEKYPYK